MRNWIFLVLMGIALFGMAIYVQTITFEYSGDDGIYTYFNKATKQGLDQWTDLFNYGSMNFIGEGATNTGTYRPFTLFTFALEHELVGKFSPSVSHTVNIVLYGGLIFLIGIFLLELRNLHEIPIVVVLLVLLLYAAHPIHTEVVASAKSRDTLLSAVFSFLSVFLWLKWSCGKNIFQKFIIGFIFFLALLSKEEAIPFVGIVGLVAYFFKKASLVESIKSTYIFIVSTLIYLGIRGMVLDSGDTVGAVSYSTKLNSILYGTSFSEHVASNFFIYLHYLKKLFYPHPLSWDYSFAQFEVQSFSEPMVWLSITIITCLVWFAWKGTTSRSIISFWILFYLVTFSIFANLTKSLIIGSNFGERFLFVPSLAFCFLVVYVVFILLEKYALKKSTIALIIVFTPILFVFTFKTLDHSKVWKSNLTLTESGIQNSPQSWRTHALYGEELRLLATQVRKEFPDSAMLYFWKSKNALEKSYEILGAELFPSSYLKAFSEVLLAVEDTARAELFLQKILSKQPKSNFALFKLGVINFGKRDYERAEHYYLRTLEAMDPDSAATFNNLGLLYLKQNRVDEAIQMFENKRRILPSDEVDQILIGLYAEAGYVEKIQGVKNIKGTENADELIFLSNLKKARTAFVENNYKEAAESFRLIRDDFEKFNGYEKFPSYYLAFGKSLLEVKDTLAAKKIFREGLEKNSKDSDILTNLGTISFKSEKNFLMAERYFSDAVKYNPKNPFQAWVNLGSALLIQRKENEAMVALENALKYKSDKSVITNLYLINKYPSDKPHISSVINGS